jgi:hypothetical protein
MEFLQINTYKPIPNKIKNDRIIIQSNILLFLWY